MTDKPNRSSSLTRRVVLTTIVGGVTIATAGCTSSGGSPDGSNNSSSGGAEGSGETIVGDGISEEDVPDFAVDDTAQPTPMLLAAEVVDAPNPIAFLDHFVVELAVGNTGGATIGNQSIEVSTQFLDNEGMSKSVNEPDPVTVALPEIESGDWDTIEADVRVNAGGDWTIAADIEEHPEFDIEIEVEPKRLTAGDAVSSEVGHFEITALEPRFERALHYETEEGGVGLRPGDATGLLAAEDGHVLVVHRFRVENTSSERSLGFGQVYSDNRFVRAKLIGEPTDTVTSEDITDDLSTLVVDEYGSVFYRNEVLPGEAVDLLAVQGVPEEDVPDASLTLSFSGDTDDVLFDTIDETPVLPRFELVEASISAGDDDPVIEATVENVGDVAGTFRGVGQFYHSRPTATDWVYLPEGMEATLNPGERTTVETVASRGDDRYRILPFERELSL